MRRSHKVLAIAVILIAVVGLLVAWLINRPAKDEAMAAGKTPADFPHAANDFFRDMDGGIPLTPAEVKGRNTWLVWTAGNEAFWDYLATNSFGSFDLLKTLSSYPCSPGQAQELRDARAKAPGTLPDYALYSRNTRFKYLGLMNEPGFTQADAPDQYGLCLDKTSRPPDFDEAVYGRPTGVLGLRLYPNPNFDQAAREKWDGNKARFYTDPAYFSDSTLVRPYRVGMGCSFCHVSHHPLYPPDDPENPAFRNLSATIGAQYFWFGRIFAPTLTPKNFVWHLVDSAQPGALDTSFIPTDHINNPRAMNAIFNLASRLDAGNRFHKETAAGGALALPQVQQLERQSGSATLGTPHVLWDGADSVGIDAALTRVFINIGEYHQQWIRHIQPIVGGKPQSPIEVAVAQKYSTFWNATQERSADLAAYLVRASAPMPLQRAPDGEQFLRGNRSPTDYDASLTRGKAVFAENCARCHSSKLPEPTPALEDAQSCNGANYLTCWKRYWDWTETPDFKGKMRDIVAAPDFLENNYLSTDARIPVTQLETEVCSAMASNAIRGHVWDNFSSETYKTLPGVGDVALKDPVTGEMRPWSTPAGGRGYQRVPSLISIWATAPFLHNNEVGITYLESPDGGRTVSLEPSTAGRMHAFDDAIRKLLWPARREGIVRRTRAVESGEEKTDGTTWLNVYTSSLPRGLQLLVSDSLIPRTVRSLIGFDSIVSDGMVQIGPIPAGTPVNLLANINIDRDDPRFSIRNLLHFVGNAKKRLQQISGQHLTADQTTAVLKELVPDLIQISACPDFIVDRGHGFGTALPDPDKDALIEFIKTF